MNGSLRPCPFCNNRAELYSLRDNVGKTVYYAACTACGIGMPARKACADRQKVVERWNRRFDLNGREMIV